MGIINKTTSQINAILNKQNIVNLLQLLALANNSTMLVPANNYIQAITIKNLSANAFTLNVGTSALGNDVVSIIVVGNSLQTIQQVNLGSSIFDIDTTLYLSSANWNNASINITAIIMGF
jgi:hypothetical protein